MGLCVLVSACAGASNGADNTTSPAAGSAGSQLSGGGGSIAGGSTGDGGGTSASGGTSGTNTTGGTGALGGTAGAAAQGGAPSNIDYSIFQLQLPTGSGNSPTTVTTKELLAGYSDSYFYTAADGGQIFMDPATGITTLGSQHCRSELRESTAAGGPANWLSSATNTMTVSGKVLQVGGGSSGSVTIAQVFNDTDAITLCELQYSVSRHGLVFFYEEAKADGSSIDLKTPIALNARYSFTLEYSLGVLTATVNGKQVHSQKPSSAVAGGKFYFKVGAYDQTSSAGPVGTTPYTVVEDYSVDIVHK